MKLYAILFFFYMASTQPNTEKSTLEIALSNLKNDRGFVLVSLFNSSEGFPGKSENAIRTQKIEAGSNEGKIVFEDLPRGTYAVAVFHDENDNGKLDTNMLGVPTEGYGSSNNQKKLFRAPNFDECKFKLDKDLVKNTISLNY